MYGVRYELRDSKLIDTGVYEGGVVIKHISCNMGGYNISNSSDTINCKKCILRLVFDQCYNFDNYKLNIAWERTPSYTETYDGYIKFYNCDYAKIEEMMSRSTITATNDTTGRMLPSIYYNDQPITGVSNTNLSKYNGQIINISRTLLTYYKSGSNGAGITTNLPRAGFITNIVLQSSYTTSFGGSAKIIAELYNASDTLIGSGEVVIQSRSQQVIQVNTEVTTGWYIKLKHTYGDGSTTLYIPHILYAEYLS